jgi:hypothetical protein
MKNSSASKGYDLVARDIFPVRALGMFILSLCAKKMEKQMRIHKDRTKE